MDDTCSISLGMRKIMSDVVPFCLTAPLIWAVSYTIVMNSEACFIAHL